MHAFLEARRAAPAVLYLPSLPLWWSTASPTLRATLTCLMRELPPDLPVLLLATADVDAAELEPGIADLFPPGDTVVLRLGAPREAELKEFFKVGVGEGGLVVGA